MNQKHVLISGGHSGIGLELTKLLLAENCKVGLIVRTEERKNEALALESGLAKVDFFFADLSRQKEVAQVAAKIAEKWEKVDVLFNNAGVLLDNLYTSDQGNEMHFEVNTLSPYLLTQQLRPLLVKAKKPIVVNTVTDMLHKQRSLDVEELLKPTGFKRLFGAYMQSKLALTMLMNDMAAEEGNLRIVSVTPGPNKTGMTKGAGMPALLRPLRNLFFAAPTKGAKLLYDAAFKEEFQQKSGIYVMGNKVKDLIIRLTAHEKQNLLKRLVVA